MAPDTAVLFTVTDSSLGRLLVARSARGVCAVLPGDDDTVLEADLRLRFQGSDIARSDDALATLAEAVARSVDAPDAGADFDVDLRGTAFQVNVWHALQQVPAGMTASYTDIAQRIGRPQSVRAVAQACAANALAVIIPCHRAVRLDGGLSGYRWGVDRKRMLLEREGAGHSA